MRPRRKPNEKPRARPNEERHEHPHRSDWRGKGPHGKRPRAKGPRAKRWWEKPKGRGRTPDAVRNGVSTSGPWARGTTDISAARRRRRREGSLPHSLRFPIREEDRTERQAQAERHRPVRPAQSLLRGGSGWCSGSPSQAPWSGCGFALLAEVGRIRGPSTAASASSISLAEPTGQARQGRCRHENGVHVVLGTSPRHREGLELTVRAHPHPHGLSDRADGDRRIFRGSA